VTGARAMARSCAVWPLAGSYCCSGRKVGLPDRRESWRVPAPVGKSSNYISPLLLRRPSGISPRWCAVIIWTECALYLGGARLNRPATVVLGVTAGWGGALLRRCARNRRDFFTAAVAVGYSRQPSAEHRSADHACDQCRAAGCGSADRSRFFGGRA
jgi:hypothetical protein